MAIVISKEGTSIMKVDDSTKTEPYYFNFNEITIRTNGDNMIVSQKNATQKGLNDLSIDYNDVTTPSGTTSGETLADAVAALF